MDEVVRCAGPGCNKPLTRLGTGRPPKYCGPNCRKAAQRERDRAAEAGRRHAQRLAEAKATAAGAWRPLEEISNEAAELAAAVLSYAAGGDRGDLAAKLAEWREVAWQLEQLATTYADATELAGQLEAEPAPEVRDHWEDDAMGNGAEAGQREQAREARRRELDALTKAQLSAMYRTRGYLASAHPLSAWAKAEIVSSLLAIEFPEPSGTGDAQ